MRLKTSALLGGTRVSYIVLFFLKENPPWLTSLITTPVFVKQTGYTGSVNNGGEPNDQ